MALDMPQAGKWFQRIPPMPLHLPVGACVVKANKWIARFGAEAGSVTPVPLIRSADDFRYSCGRRKKSPPSETVRAAA